MKSLILGAIAGLVFVGVAGTWSSPPEASADNGPHVQNQSMTTDACAGCHRAHTAQGAYLLKAEEHDLCLTCHDGSGATTNVRDGIQLSGMAARDITDPPGPPGAAQEALYNGALRGGGFDYARINTEDQTWRFSVACTESDPIGDPVPGFPTITCTDGDGTAGENVRVTMCGSGAVVPATPDNSTIAGHCSVSGTNPANYGGYYQVPGGWFLTIGVNPAGEPTTSTHSVGEDGQTVWGSGNHNPAVFNGASGAELECTSCHNPHGNGQYRILRPEPASHVLGLDPALASTFSGGVTVPDACPSGTSTSCTSGNLHDYSTTNYMNSTYVTYTTGDSVVAPIACLAGGDVTGFPTVAAGGPACPLDPDGNGPLPPVAPGDPSFYRPYVDGGNPLTRTTTATGLSAWCSQCHSRYLARSQWGTNSGDAVFKYRHSTEGSMGYNGRQCNTCHVAHGTNATYYADHPGAEEGDPSFASSAGLTGGTSLLKMDNRGMCLKCHKVP